MNKLIIDDLLPIPRIYNTNVVENKVKKSGLLIGKRSLLQTAKIMRETH